MFYFVENDRYELLIATTDGENLGDTVSSRNRAKL